MKKFKETLVTIGWSVKLGTSADGAVLVRPDGFIGWRSDGRSDSGPGSTLVQVLSSILGRGQSQPRPSSGAAAAPRQDLS